jgi:hypothetical protein
MYNRTSLFNKSQKINLQMNKFCSNTTKSGVIEKISEL